MNPATDKERILIIDDETDFCMIMKNYFLKRGYEALVAYTLKEGTRLLNDWRPQILLLDNNLPDGNGWETVESIVELNPQIRVYLISAHRNKSSFTAVNKNIVVWEKPISMQQLNLNF